jgi:hypothetical protein
LTSGAAERKMGPSMEVVHEPPATLKATATAAALFAGALLACQTTITTDGEPGTFEVRRGTIWFYGDPVTIEVADSVAAGAPLRVVVRTYGGGCVFQGYTRAVVTGLQATVEPYDSVYAPGENEACTAELRHYLHETSVTFDAAGAATIRVTGRREPEGSTITQERSITVH